MLKKVRKIDLKDVVLGQYTRANKDLQSISTDVTEAQNSRIECISKIKNSSHESKTDSKSKSKGNTQESIPKSNNAQTSKSLEIDESMYGYKDDPQVPNDSKTPTFASIVFYIDNERWEGKQ